MIIPSLILLFIIHLTRSNMIYNLPVITSNKRYIWDFLGPASEQLLQAQQWTISGFETPPQNVISSCGESVVGGPGIIASSGYVERTYNDVASHNFLMFQVNSWVIDGWNPTDSVAIYIDNVLIAEYFPSRDFSSYGVDRCGDSTKNDIRFPIVGRIPHSSTTLTFRLEYKITAAGAAFGIFDVAFSFPDISVTSSVAKSLPCPADTCIDGGVPVPVYQFKTNSGSFGACSGCPFCWGSLPSQCFVCTLGKSFDGTECISCPTHCKICSSSTKCDRCNEGYVLDSDKTCQSSCVSNTYDIQTNNLPYTACLTQCPTSQFRLWNYTCGTSCEPPLNSIPSTTNPDTICEFPCDQQKAEYLYWNGSCKTTCPLSPRIEENDFKFCDACADPDQFFYQNDTCLPSCQKYFDKVLENGFWLCNYPCQDSEFLYQDGSCKSSCQINFIERLEQNRFQFCDYPCQDIQYLYQDGSCKSSCQINFINRLEQNRFQFCDYPCPSNYFLYLNGSCFQRCQTNFIQRSEQSNFWFCEYPCHTDQYLYAQGNCQDECPYPYLKRIEGDNYNFCDLPCPDSQYYFEDRSCSLTCPEPMVTTEIGLLKLCNNPTLSTEELTQMDTLNSVHKTTQTVADSGLIVASLLTPQDPSRLTAGSLTRMLLYTRYLNITHSQKLEYMFQKSTLSQGITVPGTALTPETKLNFQSQEISYVFDKYDLNAGFLVNFWKSLVFLLTLTTVCTLLALLEYSLQWIRNIPTLRLLVPQARILIQNFLFGQFFINYGDIIFFSLLELQSNKLDSVYAVLNFTFAVSSTLIGLIIIGIHFSIVQGYQEIREEEIQEELKTKKLDKFEKKYITMQILFKDFKTLTLSRQGFLLVHNIRNMIFNIVVALFYTQPLLQIIIILLLNCFMIFYLFLRKPFLNTVALIQQIVFESVLFSVNMSWLIMAILDCANSYQTNLIKSLSEVVIFVNVISTFLPISFLVVKAIVAIINSRKSAKNPPKLNLPKIKAPDREETQAHENLVMMSVESENFSRFSQSLDHNLNFKIARLNRELPQPQLSEVTSESGNFDDLNLKIVRLNRELPQSNEVTSESVNFNDLPLQIERLNRELPQPQFSEVTCESVNFKNLPDPLETRQKRRRRIKRDFWLENETFE